MKEKSIKNKLLLTILGVAFGLALVIILISIFQMVQQKNKVDVVNSSASKELSAEVDGKLEEMNKQVARDISLSFSAQINQNFQAMRKSVESVANAAGVLYGYEPEEGVQPDNHVGLMPGATRENVRQEFSTIRKIRDFIKAIPDYDPANLDALDLYIATESGICLDGTDGSFFETVGEGEYSDLRESVWYGPTKSRAYYWASIFTGAATGKEKITCAVPFYDADGVFRGVAAGDITQDHIKETVLEIHNTQINHIILFNENGEVMLNPYHYPDVDQLTDSADVVIQGDNMITFTELEENGWKLCLIFQQDAVKEASQFVSTSIEANGSVVSEIIAGSIRSSILLFIVISSIAVIIAVIITNGVSASFVKPIKKLMEEAKIIGSGQLDHRILIGTRDEIGRLAECFNDMTQELSSYMENVKSMTADKERITAELNVAKQIQLNLLPTQFPAFQDRKEFDIYAAIHTANGGGGTFYDFFFVDYRRLCLVVGEASGSGIPTTLMGVVAMTHIKNYAQLGYTPARILAETNNQLSYKNAAALTVSVFLGIIDLHTGTMDYVNGGQMEPLWKHSGLEFAPLTSKKCFSLASMENVPYWQQSIQLVQGDLLLFYTQGVPNTSDARGNEYTETYLNQYVDDLVKQEFTLKGIVDGIERDLERFAGDSPQRQDRTLLAIRYFG